jgi:amphi-Trp domain-containing protein
MGKETRLFKSEEKHTRAEVSNFLHQLADKVAEGQVILRQGQEEIALNMPANLILEIQVEDEDKKRKGIQHSLEVEIKWFDSDDAAGGPLELG